MRTDAGTAGQAPALRGETGRRLTLGTSEASRILDELNSILARASIVSEHLEVASARCGGTVSAWTDEQLDAIMDAARTLRAEVERTPQIGD